MPGERAARSRGHGGPPSLDKQTLKSDLKKLIVETLRLEDVQPAEIAVEAPLFGNGLGLDSVYALEIVVALEKALVSVQTTDKMIDEGV